MLLHGLLVPLLIGMALGSGGPEGHPPAGKDPHRHRGVPEKFPEHPAVGETAPDFTLMTVEGRPVALGEFLGRGHLVVAFGSISSPEFRKTAAEMDRLASTWEKLEVKVLLVYTREAHPARLRREAPAGYRERVALARKARRDLKISFPILVDEWDDRVHRSYGAMPNAAFLLDPKGTILVRQAWANPSALERELRRILEVPGPPGF